MKLPSLYDKKLYRCVVLLLAVSLNVFLIGYLIVSHEWAFDSGIGPVLVKAGRFAILIACEAACLFICLLITIFAFLTSFERFYDTESIDELSAVFNKKGISFLFLFGFLCCFVYDIYHLYVWGKSGSVLFALSLCIDFAWIISLISHYNQSDDNRFVDYGKYDKHKYNRVSKGAHMGCFVILMFFTLASKTICNEGTKIIIRIQTSDCHEHIQNIADSVWGTYLDAKYGRIACDGWSETYDKLRAGTDLVSWIDPQNEIEEQIINSCRDEIESINIADGTPRIFVRIDNKKVYAELTNPRKELLNSNYLLKAQKGFVNTPPILFLYHAYNKDNPTDCFNICIDCFGDKIRIFDNSFIETGPEKLNEMWRKYTSANSKSDADADQQKTNMYRVGNVSLYELYDQYEYYLNSLMPSNDDSNQKKEYYSYDTVEIYAFRYNEHMNIDSDLIYIKTWDKQYQTQTKTSNNYVSSWIITNIK